MFYRVRISFLIAILITLLGYAIALYVYCDPIEFFCADLSGFEKFYAKDIRGHLFAAFLALGGFLLSLKTFIIVTMKANVYDNEKYQEKWREQKTLDPSLSLYGPLKELSDLLYYAILVTIVAAISQMTVGLYPSLWASLLSVFACVFAIALLLDCLFTIKSNLDIWFDHIDGKSDGTEQDTGQSGREGMEKIG